MLLSKEWQGMQDIEVISRLAEISVEGTVP
jgi:hypothetical protein